MYVLLNGFMDYEEMAPSTQLLVLGATREQVQDAIQVALDARLEESSLSESELIEAVEASGYEVLQIPVVVYSKSEGLE